jgi:hypothetical protein
MVKFGYLCSPELVDLISLSSPICFVCVSFFFFLSLIYVIHSMLRFTIPKILWNLTYTCMTGTKWSPGPAFFCHCTHLCSSWRIFLYLRLSFAMRNSILGAALCKNRPQACKIKMSKILIKCPNVGLCGPWMGKILKSPVDFYFRRKMQFVFTRSTITKKFKKNSRFISYKYYLHRRKEW